MEGQWRSVGARMPLAVALLSVYEWLKDEAWLNDFFEKHRGRGYEKALAFNVFLRLIADALLMYDRSAR